MDNKIGERAPIQGSKTYVLEHQHGSRRIHHFHLTSRPICSWLVVHFLSFSLFGSKRYINVDELGGTGNWTGYTYSFGWELAPARKVGIYTGVFTFWAPLFFPSRRTTIMNEAFYYFSFIIHLVISMIFIPSLLFQTLKTVMYIEPFYRTLCTTLHHLPAQTDTQTSHLQAKDAQTQAFFTHKLLATTTTRYRGDERDKRTKISILYRHSHSKIRCSALGDVYFLEESLGLCDLLTIRHCSYLHSRR